MHTHTEMRTEVLRKLHKLLSARAFIRASLLNATLASAYIPDDDILLRDDIHAAIQLLNSIIQRIESSIGSIVYEISEEEESPEVRKIIAEVIFKQEVKQG